MLTVGLLALKLVSVHLLTRPAGAAVATPARARARVDHRVELVVAVEADEDGTRVLFAGAPKVDLGDGRGTRDAKPWPATEPVTVAWKKVEPAVETADNTSGGHFHWDAIAYRETEWPRTDDGNALAREADVHTTILPDRGGLGTMTYRVLVAAGGATLATPGAESAFRGGLSEKVTRVSYRRDDTFLGYLTELFNTPYVWASAGTGEMHQADRQIGADCADFIAYGLRRAGKKIEYGYTGDVPRWGGGSPLFSIARRGDDGRFLDAKGNAIPVGAKGVKPGDLLLFKGHVGAFLEDRAPLGVLDANDRLVHTAWAPPSEETFEQSKQWTSAPFTVWRVR